MDTTARTTDWDSIYVSVFPRISSKITSGATYAQRKQDYNESHKTPKEITLWQFLELWKEYLDQINAIRNEPDKERRKYLKTTTLPAATICATKAHKQFSSSPLGELTEQQRRIYNELPISFTTGEGVEIAQDCGLGERAFKEWIKSKFFRHISHGKYEKRYK